MTISDQEPLALEARAEALAFVSADAAVRRGESDRFEIGRLASSDAVDGGEAQRTGGDHVESIHAHTVRAVRLETRVDGGMSLRGHSDTTLLGGAMTETHAGPMLLLAGMSDALVAGGGMRVTVADLAVAGLVGLEEKIGSAIADGALVEAYATHFEREYGPGSHTAGFANFTGTVHITSASGFRPLFKVANGVRNLTAGGGGGAGPEGPAVSPTQRPLPPPPPPARRSGSAGLIGDTPRFAGIYSEVGAVGDAGGDAARAADAPLYEDLNNFRDLVGSVEEPLYDYADVRRGALDTTGQASAAEASRGTDTADVLGDLRAAAEQQGGDDVQRGAIMDLLTDWNGLPLPDDVDEGAVAAWLEDAQLEASANAMLAGLNGAGTYDEAVQNEVAQLYDLARSMVEAGDNPQPLLDRFAAIYRWRAENGVEAYAGQADVVADTRAAIDAMFRANGYQIEAIDEAALLQDSDLQVGLRELFGSVDEGAGATDELTVRIEDASDLLGDFLNDLDEGGAQAANPQSAAVRDPQHLTVAELDAYQPSSEGNWLEELSSTPAELPGEQSAVQHAPTFTMFKSRSLSKWDGQILDFVKAHQKPALAPPTPAAGAALLEDLRTAEAATAARLEVAQTAGNTALTDVLQDRHRVYRLAADAVQQGEDPVPVLNELMEIHRWRARSGVETYAGQVRVIEGTRQEITRLFRHSGVAVLDEVADPDYLAGVRGLPAAPRDLPAESGALEDVAGSTSKPFAGWDNEIFTYFKEYRKPDLPTDREGARAQLVEDLQIAAAGVGESQMIGDAAPINAVLDRLEIYRVVEDAVQQGKNPLPDLSELVAVYRWRAQRDVETYADQARVVQNVRDEVSRLFVKNGFDTSTELADHDAAVESARHLPSAPKRLPDKPSTLAGLPSAVEDVAVGNSKALEAWDERILSSFQIMQKPDLPAESENARVALLNDLQIAAAEAGASPAAGSAALGPSKVYQLAEEAVRQGKNPLPELNEVVEIYRLRAQSDVETYADQARAIESVRDEVARLFAQNGFDVPTELEDLDDTIAVTRQMSFNQDLRRIQNAPDDRTTTPVQGIDSVYDRLDRHIPGRTPDSFVAGRDGGDGGVHARWQGRAANLEGLVDMSTEDAYARLNRGSQAGLPDSSPPPLYAQVDKSRQSDQLDDSVSLLEENLLYDRTDNYRQDEWLYARSDEISDSADEVIDDNERQTISLVRVGNVLVPMAHDGAYPFVPPRLPADADAAGLSDIVRTRRKRVEAHLLEGTASADQKIAMRFELEAHDLALAALENGHDPIPLLDNRIHAAKLRKDVGTPLISGEVEILTQVRRALGNHFDDFLDSTSARHYESIHADQAQQVNQLRLDTSSSLANARSADDAAGGEPGKVANDFVHKADEQTFGLHGNLKRREHIYEDVSALEPLSSSGRGRRPHIYEDIDALRSELAGGVDDGPQALFPQAPQASPPPQLAQLVPPDALSFASDDPTRFVGRVPDGQQAGNSKPKFRVTDREFSEIVSGDLSLVIVDVNSFKKLGQEDFLLDIGSTRTDMTTKLHLPEFTQRERVGKRWQSLQDVSVDSDAVEVSTSGHHVTSSHRGSPLIKRPSTRRRVRPRRRPEWWSVDV